MTINLFTRLVASMQQMNEIAAGNMESSRITEVTPSPHATAPDNSSEQDADK